MINETELYLRYYTVEDLTERRFIDIGGNRWRHAFWKVIDHVSNRYDHVPDIDLDLLECKDFPLDSESIQIFYTSHTIEHLTNAAVSKIFKEVYRCLKPGGYFRITTPDAKLMHALWWRINKQDFLHEIASQLSYREGEPQLKKLLDCELEAIFNNKSFEDACDEICNMCDVNIQRTAPQQHINWFTHDKVKRMLRDAGFENIYESKKKESPCEILRTEHFDMSNTTISLFVEARK